MPLVTNGDCGSSGTVFLFTVMPACAERLLRRLAGEVLGTEVHQHEVGIGAAGHDGVAELDQRVGQGLRVLHDPAGVGLEVGGERLTEGDRLGRDHVLERAALGAGKHRLVDGLGVLGGGEDQTGPRARAASCAWCW